MSVNKRAILRSFQMATRLQTAILIGTRVCVFHNGPDEVLTGCDLSSHVSIKWLLKKIEEK